MKKILFLFLFLFGLTGYAAQIITATVSVTNAAGTTNGQTITINGGVRTWTNSVNIPASQILTNNTPEGSATNLFLQIASYPISGLTLSRTTSTNIVLKASPGFILTVSVSAGWGAVSYSTNETTSATVVRVPVSVEVNAVRTNVTSGLVEAISDSSNTNAIQQMSKAAEQLVGITNTQTITGDKYFSGTIIISNQAGVIFTGTLIATNITGIVGSLTNGYWTNAILDNPTITNGTAYGSLDANNLNVRSNLSFGNFDSFIFTDNAAYFQFDPEEAESSFIGEYGNLGDGGGFWGAAVEATNWIAAPTLIASNNASLSSVTFNRTNNFPTGSDAAFGRYALTSLANGNNAAIPVGTNVFVEVSGPSSAFTVNGINGSPNRDGKFLILLNLTGQNMTIAHDSGTDPTAANRIYTMTGSDHATTANGAAILIYSASASRWILLSLNP